MKPADQVMTRFQQYGSDVEHVRFKMCNDCEKKAVKGYGKKDSKEKAND